METRKYLLEGEEYSFTFLKRQAVTIITFYCPTPHTIRITKHGNAVTGVLEMDRIFQCSVVINDPFMKGDDIIEKVFRDLCWVYLETIPVRADEPKDVDENVNTGYLF